MQRSRFAPRCLALLTLVYMQGGLAASAPDWMRAQIGATVPEHKDDTSAVTLYSETILTVQDSGKMKRLERRVYKILRSEGESYGRVHVEYGSRDRVTAMRAWSIPSEGKDYEVQQKSIVESSLSDVDGADLISDLRRKSVRIPAATIGSLVGYEIERDVDPYAMSDEWDFQDTVPVREARYAVELPQGWSYKVFWLNRPDAAPIESSAGHLRWRLTDLKPVALEQNMPPWRGIAGRMVISLQPPDGQPRGFQSWKEIGTWYLGLVNGRRDVSPDIRQKVRELTATAPDVLAKMQALAAFVQNDVRYVAIELGIGGIQPHAAAEVFAHRYGDCKDKVTLLSSMLKEVGIESHYVIINTQRGSINAATPPNLGFNHAVLAIQLPASVDTRKLPALMTHKTLGRVLFFDPTHPLIPFGYLPGNLQANFGMLVTPEGGELVQLPQTNGALNGVQRVAKLVLDANGALRGDVTETWNGDSAAAQRFALRNAQQEVDRIKSVESMLTHSLSTFEIVKASVSNVRVGNEPLIWNYTLDIDRYARPAADLLLVRPRVFGNLGSGMLETKDPRQHPIEFESPSLYTDVFDITLPVGYTVDELPPAVNEDLGFVAYHSASELQGNVLRYKRTAEIREVSVPVAKAEALRQFFRVIENDERMAAVLKRAP